MSTTPSDIAAGELLPCPFCGRTNAMTIHIRDGRKVACICGGCGKPEFNGRLDHPSAEARAISSWNRRASPWQPIETAPKGAPLGAWIIGCRAGQPESVGTVTWRNGFWLRTDGERWIENWLTHWMPLPSAPSQIEEG